VTTTAQRKKYGVPPFGPLPWLIRHGATSGLSLVVDPRLQRSVPRIPTGMFSIPVPSILSRWGAGSRGVRNLVFVGDPKLVRQVFAADPTTLHFGDPNPIGRLTGRKSLFWLNEDEHLAHRRMVLPPFHGKRMGTYESIVEEEALREMATWPEGRAFSTTGPFMRITLAIILRAVFGMREGWMMEEMREQTPKAVAIGSRMMVMPPLQRDLAPWYPWDKFRALIQRFEWGVNALIDAARRDPELERRADVLALFARATHEDDGSPLTDEEIADELKAVVAAGHETTANTLAWAVERLRRHPDVLRRLVREADDGAKDLRIATIYELQRTRPVIPGTGRLVVKPFELGDYILPPGTVLVLPTPFLHFDPEVYPDPLRFNPDRFLGQRPDPNSWIPFGGGIRRCPGAAFAHMEMDIVLRTLLREVELQPTRKGGERMFFRGIAFAPMQGGKAVIRRRQRAREAAPSLAAAA
jgi:cytochrome P450